mmetsp:Transcript_34534/g.55109  ORF Transcript_34534/g.55109 Transcript_34534/m.55109 type:complete len:544 (+) Transcript_34534:1120-2751(+)|eukprot:CAMPEP_0203763918 /NCGR_PEP_ID=MMETSP0098-20131031/17093_1 /ASSEMBLY_ACC=CAM_ASM_000208 /TAXON_ID=96639 /ORGANISM=" , Strain NY0313808BC1" /LENGTH=543 /DNA_ID=CAMNT_0050659303 /DNA_START=600 /DNA_END=2228 /DNA_ORIENTATION=-
MSGSLGDVLALPEVDEVEPDIDESKLAEIRDAMKNDIKDDLDVPMDDGEDSDMHDAEDKSDAAEMLFSSRHINVMSDLKSRSKFIPLRLNREERRLLNIVEGALDISEYTDKVDVSANNYFARSTYNKEDTMSMEQEALCKKLAGLGVCNDYRTLGAEILDKDLSENEEFYARCLEIGRRYKIMNPDKMRTNYGKLLYVIMDNVNPSVRRRVQMCLKKRVVTVMEKLDGGGGLALLTDPLLAVAASEIEKGSPEEVAKAQQLKKVATEEIMRRYSSNCLNNNDLHLVISSISDSFSFLRSNRDPVDRMIMYLKKYFSPSVVPPSRQESLEIRRGHGGSKLSHTHEMQFYFVLQSLTLWREIMGNFFKLWCLAEEDLLDDRNGYRLCNTGQGLQRCQGAPRVQREMSKILATVKTKVGRWIGLSVVHLGDKDVPNSLIFIDKYTQVPRLLGPIVNTLDKIEELEADPDLNEYIQTNFQGSNKLRKLILADYFRHGFDGSGDDGGSCIDGRLTSTWNWCNQLEKKKFHSIFMLTNFQGFDGDFRN